MIASFISQIVTVAKANGDMPVDEIVTLILNDECKRNRTSEGAAATVNKKKHMSVAKSPTPNPIKPSQNVDGLLPSEVKKPVKVCEGTIDSFISKMGEGTVTTKRQQNSSSSQPVSFEDACAMFDAGDRICYRGYNRGAMKGNICASTRVVNPTESNLLNLRCTKCIKVKAENPFKGSKRSSPKPIAEAENELPSIPGIPKLSLSNPSATPIIADAIITETAATTFDCYDDVDDDVDDEPSGAPTPPPPFVSEAVTVNGVEFKTTRLGDNVMLFKDKLVVTVNVDGGEGDPVMLGTLTKDVATVTSFDDLNPIDIDGDIQVINDLYVSDDCKIVYNFRNMGHLEELE